MPILSTLEELRYRAIRNSSKKYKGLEPALKRREFAQRLLKGRQMDREGTWGVSFDASLEHISKEVYHLDLLKEILTHQAKRTKGYTFLDLGGGSGRLASDVAGKISPKTTILLAAIARNDALWRSQPRGQRIRPIITHMEQLSKKLPPKSVDFINASYSILHAQHVWKALGECRTVLKKGGRIIFNMGSLSNGFERQNEFQQPPQGFKFVMPPKEVTVKKGPFEFGDTIIYLEKI